MKITKEIEEFINLTITEHMGKEYADWKLSQPSVTEPDEVEEEYKKVIATLPQKQEEAITKYCDQIFNSGAETEEFFYRLGLRDGMKLRKTVKIVLKQLSELYIQELSEKLMSKGKGINRKKLVPFVLPIFIFSQNPMQRIFEKQTERRSC